MVGAAESAPPFEGWQDALPPPTLKAASVQLAAKGKDMTADQLKRKLRNFPVAKLTGLAALSA